MCVVVPQELRILLHSLNHEVRDPVRFSGVGSKGNGPQDAKGIVVALGPRDRARKPGPDARGCPARPISSSGCRIRCPLARGAEGSTPASRLRSGSCSNRCFSSTSRRFDKTVPREFRVVHESRGPRPVVQLPRQRQDDGHAVLVVGTKESIHGQSKKTAQSNAASQPASQLQMLLVR